MRARAGVTGHPARVATRVSEDRGRPNSANARRARSRADVTAARRTWLAAAIAMVAFVAAILVALVSTSEARGVYRWPAPRPADALVATGRPSLAHLLLARHTAARVSIDVPCQVVPATSASGKRFIVAATASDAVTARGLWLAVDGPALRMGVGNTVLAGLPWLTGAAHDADCTVASAFDGRAWHLDVDGKEIRHGTNAPPIVTGLSTDLPRPIEGQRGLSVEVVTEVTGTSPSFGQIALTVLAIGAAVLAIVLLLVRPHRNRVPSKRPERLRSLTHHLAWIDAVVVGGLLVWWIFGPVLYDDGWVLATVLKFSRNGTFSNYYDVLDAQYPLGFVQFMFHFATSRLSTSLLWMRFPILVIGGATWALLRTYLTRLGVVRDRVSRAALASMFLLFWFAWLSTLRPEPMIVLLSAITIVAVQRFYRSATLGALVIAVLAATVAVSIHPEGVVVIAPLLVATPAVWRWLRARPHIHAVALVVLGLTAAAGLVLLVTADSDLTLWRENRHIFAGNHFNALSWRDEFYRYQLLFDNNNIWGPVVRRATVVFAPLAVVLFVTRSFRRREPAYNLPILSLVVAGFLMALTPSKWPWQLGSLGAFAALAVATEVALLGREPVGSASRKWRSAVVLAAALGASVAAWRGGAFFGDFAIVGTHFGRGGSGFLGVDLGSPVPWLVLAGIGVVVAFATMARRSRHAARAALDRFLASSGVWAVPIAVGIVVVATLALFVSDAVRQGSAWSLPRQEYADLVGRTCGIADYVGVADAAAGAPLTMQTRTPARVNASVPGVGPLPPLEFTAAASPPPPSGVDLGATWGSATTGDGAIGTFSSPWFTVEPDATRTAIDQPGLAIFTAGMFTRGNRLYAQFGRADSGGIEPLGMERVHARDSGSSWEPSALAPPHGTDSVRVIAVDATSVTGGWLAFSAPRHVTYHPLDHVLTQHAARALVGPAVRFYFPCAVEPVIDGGVAQVPDYTVAGRTDRGVGLWPQSPTANLLDFYSVRPLLVRGAPGTNVDGLEVDRIVTRPSAGLLAPFQR